MTKKTVPIEDSLWSAVKKFAKAKGILLPVFIENALRVAIGRKPNA